MVVITGASAGVGRATALEFAKHGAKIGLLAREARAIWLADSAVREISQDNDVMGMAESGGP